jgi:hypothetical protein
LEAGLLSPLISSSLLHQNAGAIFGTPFEISLTLPHLVVATMHAVRYHDGILALSVPPALRGEASDASERAVEAMLALAEHAGYDRPLILISRLAATNLHQRGAEEALVERLHRDVQAGFTTLSINVDGLPVEQAEQFAFATSPFWDQGIGFELECSPDADPTLILAEIAATPMPVAGIRGAAPTEDLPDAFHVADALGHDLQDNVPWRMILDGALIKRLMKSGPLELADQLRFNLGAMDLEADAALVELRDVLTDLPGDVLERLEAWVYSDVDLLCQQLRCRGLAERLLVALQGPALLETP